MDLAEGGAHSLLVLLRGDVDFGDQSVRSNGQLVGKLLLAQR